MDALPPMPFQDRCVEHPISKRWILLPDVDDQHPLVQWKSIAQSDHSILLTGEAGLGLEDIAVLLATNGTRSDTVSYTHLTLPTIYSV